MEITPWMAIGFLLAAYSVTANDSLQTLGSYLSSNEACTPKGLQMLFLCTITALVLMGGWFINQGEPAWGRLASFPQPDCFSPAYLIPPIAVLALTAWGAPVSTSFLLLSAFVPENIGSLVTQSVLGYLLALSLGLAVWGLGVALMERLFQFNDQPSSPTHSEFNLFWYGLQWCSTGWLWSLWLIQDLANIFIFLPRSLDLIPMLLCTASLCLGLCALVAVGGGPIQNVLRSKTNTSDLRSATVIDLMFAVCLLTQNQLSSFPLSTTWVFLGLLAGREMALTLRLRSAESHGPKNAIDHLSNNLSQDIWKAGAGLIVSLMIALGLQPLISLTSH